MCLGFVGGVPSAGGMVRCPGISPMGMPCCGGASWLPVSMVSGYARPACPLSGYRRGVRIPGVCFGYRRRGRGVCCVPPPVLRVGAAACYSPTSCRMQYHRRARSSLPGSEWVRASPLGHGRRKSVIIIPGILVGCSRGLCGGLGTGWWTRVCAEGSVCDARGVSPSSE